MTRKLNIDFQEIYFLLVVVEKRHPFNNAYAVTGGLNPTRDGS
jgi:hypothetical protein